MDQSNRQPAMAVVMQSVSRDVPVGGGAVRRILHEVSLQVERGGLLHIVGPSGSGKSTLVRLLNRLDERTGGRLEVLGRAVEDWPPRQLRRRVAMVFQEPMLLDLTVEQNLRLPFELAGEVPRDFARRCAAVLEMVGLDGTMGGRVAEQLSVGQKQRVTLARALIGKPEMLLLDEPTSSLDVQSAGRLLDRLSAIRQKEGLTVVMVTHRLAEARRMGGAMAVVMGGQVAAWGPVEQVLAEPPGAAVADFLHGAEGHGTG